MPLTLPTLDLTIILPIVVLTITALVVLLLDQFVSDEGRAWNAYAALAGVVLSALSAIVLQSGRSGTTLAGMAVLDGFGLVIELLLLGIAALTILFSMAYLRQQNINRGEYYVLTLFVTVGGMVMATSSDLITIFLGLELLSLALYILAAFNRARPESAEAGMKYLLLGGFASAFLLYGIALTFGAAGTTSLPEIAKHFKAAGTTDLLALAGIALLLVGFGFKIAAAPFHAWVPDVYEGAPTAATAFMSSAAKVAGFAALIRVLYIAFPAPGLLAAWGTALAVLAALTMTIGNLGALMQDNIKRMLAYSGIAHAGYILVALATGSQGITTQQVGGLEAAVFYLVAYSLMNLGAWMVVLALGRDGKENLSISDFAGLASRRPALAAAMLLFLLSLAGIPPTAGLMGKWLVFSSAVGQGLLWLAVIGVLNSVISIGYYLRVVMLMYTKPADETVQIGSPSGALQVAIVVAAVGVLVLGVLPGPVISWVQTVGFLR
ncbi:MAG: NADH-quinone oxidoreductase subunit N [Chloroflexi bacterium]|nr:NADH-quinone oxidoreductase subunit N [Chloroflexota bacterium]